MMPRKTFGYATAVMALLSLTLGGCAGAPGSSGTGPDRDRAEMSSADPQAAVRYYLRAVEREPDNPDHRRGLADAYARGNRLDEARDVYLALIASEAVQSGDRIGLATVYLRKDDLDEASEALAGVPEGQAGSRGALVEAMLADRNEDWGRADGAYARAVDLSDAPAAALNNWGMSRLARGDRAGAERTFAQAVSADPRFFLANNNLGIVRAMQGKYRAPATRLDDESKARLLFNMGLVAEDRGDRDDARRLLRAATRTHPRHYAAAAERIALIDG